MFFRVYAQGGFDCVPDPFLELFRPGFRLVDFVHQRAELPVGRNFLEFRTAYDFRCRVLLAGMDARQAEFIGSCMFGHT